MHVTIVMAVYNEIESVHRAIDSLLQQTYQDWDLVIVDDCSTDGTKASLLKAYQNNQKIKVIGNAGNMGLAYSLNVGWRNSSSQIIARMDADDVCYPERLQKQVEFMRHHPEIDVLGTGAELIGQDGDVQNRIFLPEKNDQIQSGMFNVTPFFHPSVMMRRRFLEGVNGYDESLRRGQDFELWAKGKKYGYTYHNLQEILIRYRTKNYKKTIKNIWFGFLTDIIVAIRYKYYARGFFWSIANLVKNLLIRFGLYEPVAIRGKKLEK